MLGVFTQADTLKKKREMAAVIVDCTSRDVERNKVTVSYKLWYNESF